MSTIRVQHRHRHRHRHRRACTGHGACMSHSKVNSRWLTARLRLHHCRRSGVPRTVHLRKPARPERQHLQVRPLRRPQQLCSLRLRLYRRHMHPLHQLQGAAGRDLRRPLQRRPSCGRHWHRWPRVPAPALKSQYWSGTTAGTTAGTAPTVTVVITPATVVLLVFHLTAITVVTVILRAREGVRGRAHPLARILFCPFFAVKNK